MAPVQQNVTMQTLKPSSSGSRRGVQDIMHDHSQTIWHDLTVGQGRDYVMAAATRTVKNDAGRTCLELNCMQLRAEKAYSAFSSRTKDSCT